MTKMAIAASRLAHGVAFQVVATIAVLYGLPLCLPAEDPIRQVNGSIWCAIAAVLVLGAEIVRRVSR